MTDAEGLTGEVDVNAYVGKHTGVAIDLIPQKASMLACQVALGWSALVCAPGSTNKECYKHL